MLGLSAAIGRGSIPKLPRVCACVWKSSSGARGWGCILSLHLPNRPPVISAPVRGITGLTPRQASRRGTAKSTDATRPRESAAARRLRSEGTRTAAAAHLGLSRQSRADLRSEPLSHAPFAAQKGIPLPPASSPSRAILSSRELRSPHAERCPTRFPRTRTVHS